MAEQVLPRNLKPGVNPNQDLQVVLREYGLKDPWDIVDLFEAKLAAFAGSKYAVAVDNCTDAMFLCLKYLRYTGEVVIPSRTYVSVPCTIIHAGARVKFDRDYQWSGAYELKPTGIIDGACRFRKGMYKPGTFHCLSFHIRKHLGIGKGGMVLTDSKEAVNWFKQARYEGRHTDILYKHDKFSVIGWNMYMTPEDAARGLQIFEAMDQEEYPDMHNDENYCELADFPMYENPQLDPHYERNALLKTIEEQQQEIRRLKSLL